MPCCFSREYKSEFPQIDVITSYSIHYTKLYEEEILELLKELKVKVVKIVPDFVSTFNFMEMLKEGKLEIEPHENVMVVDIGAEATKRNNFV